MANSKKIALGGKEFTLLPCPAIGLREVGKDLALIGSASESGINALVTAIYYGVKRGIPNDQEFTREFVEWNIDVTNLNEMAEAFAEINRVNQPQEASSGEAPAAN